MEIMKVFDVNRPARCPQSVFEVTGILSCELYGNGNDGYFPVEVVPNPNADEHGGGYVSMEELQTLMDWLRSHGAVDGETVLVKHWW
jgi:hypothetical protein